MLWKHYNFYDFYSPLDRKKQTDTLIWCQVCLKVFFSFSLLKCTISSLHWCTLVFVSCLFKQWSIFLHNISVDLKFIFLRHIFSKIVHFSQFKLFGSVRGALNFFLCLEHKQITSKIRLKKNGLVLDCGKGREGLLNKKLHLLKLYLWSHLELFCATML